jgi:A-kinase anchor protein 1, mitochondrial
MGGWFRAQVVSTDAETETCDVRFLDYGGYLNIAQSALRQIRQDFLTLPFQAAECYLANVKPTNGIWMQEAVSYIEQLTHGQVIQAQIYGYAENSIPVVYLFSIQGSVVSNFKITI